MASTAIFTCVCGIQKRTSNHWILAMVTPHTVKFSPWDRNLALSDNVIVLCGEGCAAALLSRSLGNWKQASMAEAASQSVSLAA